VLEYSGALVRPVVADRLEATTYNQLVGAGEWGRGGWRVGGWRGGQGQGRKQYS
jgi:hypothetical protein